MKGDLLIRFEIEPCHLRCFRVSMSVFTHLRACGRSGCLSLHSFCGLGFKALGFIPKKCRKFCFRHAAPAVLMISNTTEHSELSGDWRLHALQDG